MNILFKIIQFFYLFFNFLLLNSLYSESFNNKIYLTKFKSLNKYENLTLSNSIQKEISNIGNEKGFQIIFDKGYLSSIDEYLNFAKISGASYLIDGRFIQNDGKNLEIYAQIYDVGNKIIIDAYHINYNYTEIDTIKLDPKELLKSNEEIIREASNKIIARLKFNPKKKQRLENIEDSLVSQYFYNKLEFPIKSKLTQSSDDVFKLLQESDITTASRTKESVMDVPASTIVISEKDIRNRGYMSLDEIISDLPGFDAIMTHGTDHITFYQRGYRTPFSSRTLFMINGIIENDSWAQVATLSRQYPVTNIKRIEIIYGPSSAVYGPNAFLGIINVITKDGRELTKNNSETKVSLQHIGGSYNGKSIDASSIFRMGEATFALSGKHYEGTDPDFSKKGGYNSNYWSSQPQVWGPILYYGDAGKPFGKYSDPVRDSGAIINYTYKTLKVGLTHYNKEEGYGPVYPSDKSQPATSWSKSSTNFSVENTVDITSKLSSYSLFLYRDNRIYGHWAEADDYPYNGKNMNSTVSYTTWNSRSKTLLVNQNIEYKFNDKFKLISGIKFEFKRLTKEYDVPGYYNSYSSVDFLSKNINTNYKGSFANVPSTDPFYLRGPGTKSEMPDANSIGTWDRGGFLLGILDIGKFRLSPGIRYDQNSIYGSSVNPRATVIYKPNENNAIKFLYGEAFNEPSPLQLFAGYTGRTADLNLKPEKAKSSEIVYIHQQKKITNELSLYYSRYENVIKESAKNAGRRRIYGLEYKLKINFDNFLPKSDPINLYFYYTFTEALSSIHYDHKLAPTVKDAWMNGDTIFGSYEYLVPDLSPNLPRRENYTTLGDIAPHKVNFGINLPVYEKWNFNLRGNYVSKRQLYSRNPLNNEGKTIDPYTIFHLVINYDINEFGFLTLKILNLLNHDYLQPGVNYANSGDNYYMRSAGYDSSLLPQANRSYVVSATFTF